VEPDQTSRYLASGPDFTLFYSDYFISHKFDVKVNNLSNLEDSHCSSLQSEMRDGSVIGPTGELLVETS